MVFYDKSYDLICEIQKKQIEQLEKDLTEYKELYLKEKQKNIELNILLENLKSVELDELLFKNSFNKQAQEFIKKLEERL